jgi:hypothetical protein
MQLSWFAQQNMAAAKPEIYFLLFFYERQAQFTFCQDEKYISLTESMFSGSENVMASSKRLIRPYFETGSDKLKMAVKPEVPLSQLL